MSTLCLAFVKTGEDGHAEVGLNAFKKAFSLFFGRVVCKCAQTAGCVCLCARVSRCSCYHCDEAQ